MRLYLQALIPLVLVFLFLVSLGSSVVTLSETYPWSTPTSEQYPWLDYLANLTSERNVELIILTRHEQSIQTLARQLFLSSEVAKKLGIVNIRFVYVDAALWPKYIETAKERGMPIDIAWGGGPTLFNNLDNQGYLMPIDPSTRPEHYAIIYELSKIPERIAGAETFKRDDQGRIRWIGASLSSFGFTINKDVLNNYGLPTPHSWEDLTKPEFAKYLPGTPLIGTADPTMSTSNLRIFEIILQAKGWEEGWRILTLLAANARIYPGSGDARDAVIRSEVAVSTTIDFYGYMAMNVNPSCEYVAPEGETIINADPIAILKSTRYPVHAAAFVAWVLSEFGGQQVWLDKDINRIPINPKTFETPGGAQRPDLKQAFDTLSQIRGIEFNETLSTLWVNAVMYYFKATLVDAHEDLQVAWSKIATAYLEGKITRDWLDRLTRELSKPLEFTDPVTGRRVNFTIDYAIEISPLLTNASIYQALMTTWTQLARERYNNVLSLLDEAIRESTMTKTTTTITTTTQETTNISTPTPTGTTTLGTTTVSTSTQVTTGGISTTAIALIVVLIVVVIALVFLSTRRK